VPQLLNRGDVRVLVRCFITPAVDSFVVSLVEDGHRADFLVDCVHELFKSLKVHLKLLHKFFTILIKCRIEEFIANKLNLVCDLLLSLRLLVLAKLSFESLRVDIMLQLHDIEQLPLKHLQRLFQLTVFLGHLMEEALLVLAHH